MIVDFMPVSMADFPGRVAATVFIGGCSFRCPYCHNSPLLTTTSASDTKKRFFDYLQERKSLIDGVCITGGEPTLWPRLEKFICKLQELGFAVKLDTNGSSPKTIKRLLEQNLLDYIAMDIKAPINKYHLFTPHVKDIEAVLDSVELLRNQTHCGYEFRTTVHQKLLSLKDFELIGKWLTGSPLYVLQGYRYSENVLDLSFCGTQRCSMDFLEEIRNQLTKQGYFKKIEIKN